MRSISDCQNVFQLESYPTSSICVEENYSKCDKIVREYFMDECEGLLSVTPDQHHNTLLSIPCIDFHVKGIQQTDKVRITDRTT